MSRVLKSLKIWSRIFSSPFFHSYLSVFSATRTWNISETILEARGDCERGFISCNNWICGFIFSFNVIPCCSSFLFRNKKSFHFIVGGKELKLHWIFYERTATSSDWVLQLIEPQWHVKHLPFTLGKHGSCSINLERLDISEHILWRICRILSRKKKNYFFIEYENCMRIFLAIIVVIAGLMLANRYTG